MMLTNKGGISSYSARLLVVSYFQNCIFVGIKKKLFLEQNSAQLLINFIKFYASLKFSIYCISPFLPKIKISFSPFVPLDQSTPGITIIDPLDSKNNVSKMSYNYSHVERLFVMLAFTIESPSNDSLLNSLFETSSIFSKLSNLS